MEVSFRATKREARDIGMARDRAVGISKNLEALDVEMDLTATNANGCPLDLAKLLAFDDFNFMHDIYGIARHLNRRTGVLGDCFRPRCAK